jgi:hypothetical protein
MSSLPSGALRRPSRRPVTGPATRSGESCRGGTQGRATVIEPPDGHCPKSRHARPSPDRQSDWARLQLLSRSRRCTAAPSPFRTARAERRKRPRPDVSLPAAPLRRGPGHWLESDADGREHGEGSSLQRNAASASILSCRTRRRIKNKKLMFLFLVCVRAWLMTGSGSH